ncbi:hypothetical protein BYT27DRAFT_7198350 [Phlegmacium glaucopus]|nr:hypothetical protein BYT27DRAFT_7198350 [Phlegmacium glaucopus]
MTIFSRLSLYPATTEQTLESRKHTFHQWGRGNTLQEYLERDENTDNHEVARDGRGVTWILAPRDSWNSLDFLCSCETFRRDALSIKKSNDSGNKTFPADISGYGIASVHTPVANRGRGYARHMMRLLHWVLAPESSLPKVFPAEWGNPPPRVSVVGDASFSVLFSDIGERFYRQSGTLPNKEDGWVVADPVSTTWDVAETHKLVFHAEARPRLQWKWLDEELVRDIWDKDAIIMKEELSSSSIHTTNFTFLPDRGVAEFQCHRLRFAWRKMNPQPVYWGVCHKDGKDNASDASTFATWTLDVRPPASYVLIITRIRVQPTDFEELFLQIISLAKQHSVEMIEVWNLPLNLRDAGHRLGGKTFSRDEHLPSFKWYGGERHEELSWLNNEKFCWC